MKYLKIFGLLCVAAAISFVIININSPLLNADKEQDLVIDLNKRLDSLQTKIEEEQKQYARLDSAEKALDSVNIKMQELQKEKELLQWRVDSAVIMRKMIDSINIIATKVTEFGLDSIHLLNAKIDSISIKKQVAMDCLSMLEEKYIASESKSKIEKNRYDSLQAEYHRERNNYVEDQKALKEQIRKIEEKIIADSIAYDSTLQAALHEIATKRPDGMTDEERKQVAIAQMNYCIHAIYKIKSCSSLDFYNNLYDEMDNNLKTEDIKGMPEIKEYRQEIRRSLHNLIRTEEDKNMYMEVLAIRKKTKKMQAIKNALNIPMSPGAGNSYAMIFNGILAIARTASDLVVAKYEDDIEFRQDMYVFDSENNDYKYLLQISQHDYIWEIFNKYDLEEYNKQTGKTIEEYYEALTSERRRARLENDSLKFNTMPDYYYDLGMAYLEEDYKTGYEKAKVCFERYLNKPTVLKIDSKRGIIALTQIIYDTSLSNDSIIEKVNLIMSNLPNNEMARFLCVKKLYEIGEKELAFKNLYLSIDVIDDDETLIALAMKYFNEIKSDPNMHYIYTELCDALLKSEGLTLTQYLAGLVDTDTNQRNTELSQVFSVKNGTLNQYIVKNNFESKGAFISDSIGVFYEKVKGNTIDIYECDIEKNTITETELLEQLPFLEKNSMVIPYFYEAIDKEGKIRMAKYVPNKFQVYKDNSDFETNKDLDSCFALLDSHYSRLYYLRNNLSCCNEYAEDERIRNNGINERDSINKEKMTVENTMKRIIYELTQKLNVIKNGMDEVRDKADYKTQEEYDKTTKHWLRFGRFMPKDSEKYLALQKDSICIEDSIREYTSELNVKIANFDNKLKKTNEIINGLKTHKGKSERYENGTFFGEHNRPYTPYADQRGGDGEYVSIVLKDEFGYFKPILLTYKLESDGSFRFYSSQHSSGEMYRKYEDINNQHSVFKMFK